MGKSSKNDASQQYQPHPFLLPPEEIYRHLGTNKDTGLTKLKAQEAQRNYGPNRLKGEGVVQWYSVLIKQVSNAMILVRIYNPYTMLISL